MRDSSMNSLPVLDSMESSSDTVLWLSFIVGFVVRYLHCSAHVISVSLVSTGLVSRSAARTRTYAPN